MRYEFKIGLRFLFGRTKEKFISLISIISILGVATGVATLIIVIGVMNGFDKELRDRIIGTSSDIVIDKIGGLGETDSAASQISDIQGVAASAPFVTTQALIVRDDKFFTVIVRGIRPALERNVTDVDKLIVRGSLDLKDKNSIILGKHLAERLMLKVGDRLKILSAADKKPQEFKITGIFSSGMYDYDMNVVFVSLKTAQEFTGALEIISGLSVRIDDVYKAEKLKKKIQEKLGFPYYARSWMDLNRNLFNALKLEKTAMFVILTLIVLVAAMNISSTLIMMVMEKTKDVGILKSIGVPNRSIAVIFTFVGVSIGVIGIGIGTAAGMGMAYLLKTYEFIKLPEDVYYISKLPVSIAAGDVLWIVAAAFIITLCSTFYPASQASRLSPVEALRYE